MLSRYRVHTGNLWSMASVDLMAESEQQALEMSKALIPTCYSYDSYVRDAEDDWQNGRVWLSYEASVGACEICLTEKETSTVVSRIEEIRNFNKDQFDWAYKLAAEVKLPVWYVRALRG